MADASPVTWNLSQVGFSDGSIATGSFVFDADTVTYSAINIVTTTPTVGGTFQFACVSPCNAGGPAANLILFLTESSSNDLTATPGLAVVFLAPLTNAGGSVGINFGLESLCENATCNVHTGPLANLVSGSVVSTTTPEPTSALLFGAGLAGILALRRRLARI
jgi:hypothetical protein